MPRQRLSTSSFVQLSASCSRICFCFAYGTYVVPDYHSLTRFKVSHMRPQRMAHVLTKLFVATIHISDTLDGTPWDEQWLLAIRCLVKSLRRSSQMRGRRHAFACRRSRIKTMLSRPTATLVPGLSLHLTSKHQRQGRVEAPRHPCSAPRLQVYYRVLTTRISLLASRPQITGRGRPPSLMPVYASTPTPISKNTLISPLLHVLIQSGLC